MSQAFLPVRSEAGSADSADNPPWRRARGFRPPAFASRTSGRESSNQAWIVASRPRGKYWEAVALSRRRSRSEAKGSLWWCAFAHGLSPGGGPAAGAAVGLKPECSPEATALPGGGTVRGHTPSSRLQVASSVPSDRSGGSVLLRAAWPPRAAKGDAGDSGRIVRDEITNLPTYRLHQPSRRFEAKLR